MTARKSKPRAKRKPLDGCSHGGRHSEHYDSGSCGTPYCEWTEFHCLECGRFVVRCGCGFECGESGWPRKRWWKIWRKQEAAALAKYEAQPGFRVIRLVEAPR